MTTEIGLTEEFEKIKVEVAHILAANFEHGDSHDEAGLDEKSEWSAEELSHLGFIVSNVHLERMSEAGSQGHLSKLVWALAFCSDHFYPRQELA